MASYRLWRDRIHKTVIIDSSIILTLFEFSIDLEKELTRILGLYNILIPNPVVKEIKFLSEHGKGEKKAKAKASLRIIEKYKPVQVESTSGDESIIELASKTNGIVVTNDKQLRYRLKKNKIPVIYLRAKKKLVME